MDGGGFEGRRIRNSGVGESHLIESHSELLWLIFFKIFSSHLRVEVLTGLGWQSVDGFEFMFLVGGDDEHSVDAVFTDERVQHFERELHGASIGGGGDDPTDAAAIIIFHLLCGEPDGNGDADHFIFLTPIPDPGRSGGFP